ncbi:MAG: EAL domain-containing protein [Agathobacter sp.]|nr:EAL domain-containing protein [Agathobacter sp.]
MDDVLFYQNYVIAGDVVALALCAVVAILLCSTYTVKKTNLNIFRRANLLVAVAALSSIIYHWVIENLTHDNVIWLYVFRFLAYVALIWTYVCFCIYIRNVAEMSERSRRIFRFTIPGAGILFTVLLVLDSVTNIGFYVDENLQIHQNYYFEVFRFAYVYYTLSVAIMLIYYRHKLIAKMMRSIWLVSLLSFGIMVYQAEFLNTTYTAVTFAFPIIMVLFLFHYNSYDVETGTLDQYAFNEYLNDMRGKNFSVISLSLPEIQPDKMRKLSIEFLRKNDTFFNNSCCFRLRNNRIVLIYQKEKNPKYEKTLDYMFKEFTRVNDEAKNDYRIILTENINTISTGVQYIEFFEYMEDSMPTNEVKVCTAEEVKAFTNHRYLLEQLKDIYKNDNLDDERVKVYCQPVLNTEKNTFSTAEALMRLELPESGLVYPDQFIPLLERFNFIHVFSKIILNKTCKALKELEAQEYQIDRISINFSIQELKLDTFSNDVMDIIHANGVDPNKIAIELTESKNEKDFNNMKRIMESMQEQGIKFYLDDFGTGYSNFERIIGLPIDTIKFDRSLTILAGKNDESRFMVGSFSEIFKKADYQILFEGVEDEHDEMQCKDMNALYLQGYRYSRPIPIEQLKGFLEKTNK